MRNLKLEKNLESNFLRIIKESLDLLPDSCVAYKEIWITIDGVKSGGKMFLAKGMGYLMVFDLYPYFCTAYVDNSKESKKELIEFFWEVKR